MFLGTFLDNFESFEVFPILIFSEFRPPTVPWANFFTEKNTSKHVENMFEHFWERFYAFWKKESFSSFLKFFQVWTFQGALGIFFLRKLSQNKFETCLDTFKNVFGHFWEFKIFSFFRIFTSSDLQVALGKKNSKNYLKQVGTLWIRFLAILTIWSCFDFWIFFWVSRVHWAEIFPSKKSIKTFSNNVFWERFWTILKISKFFLFSKFFPNVDPPGCTGDFLFERNYLKTCSEHAWTLLGTVLDILELLKFSIFSHLFFSWPPRVHWAKFLPEKWPRNMFKTCLIAFGNVFWAFWKIESFSSFLKFFQVSTLQGALGIFSWESYLKTSSKLVWTILGTFLNTFEISKLFRFFFEFFQVSTLQGALGKIFLRKDYLEACSKRVWTFLRTFLGILKKNESFSKFGPTRVHWAFFPRKLPQNKFGHFWKSFSGFSKFEFFSISVELFWVSRVLWA